MYAFKKKKNYQELKKLSKFFLKWFTNMCPKGIH